MTTLRYAIPCLLLAGLAAPARAQDSAAVLWPLTSMTTTSATVAGHIGADNEQPSSAFVIRDYLGTNNSQRIYAKGSGLGYWPPDSSQNDSIFAEFRVRPLPGISLSIDSLSFYLGNSGGSSSLRANVYLSTDSFATSMMLDSNIVVPSKAMQFQRYTGPFAVDSNHTLLLRIYPWLVGGVASGKYFNLQTVSMWGTTTGTGIVYLPTVTTTALSLVSTTTAFSGGNVTADGGAPVTARGVCWDTLAAPTVAADTTNDGGGAGSFLSFLRALTPGTTYHLRAYATNSAGTGYGTELSFTTLTAITAPSVTTSGVSNVWTNSAASGGTVTSWGGDSVTARGVCWNTTGAPTLADSHTNEGPGIGQFTSSLTGLDTATTYYVRAYAVNDSGTGYGSIASFKTLSPAPPRLVVVARDGSGDYTTVQAAFDGVPDMYTGPYTIFVKKGTYHEKLLLPSSKRDVILLGEDRDSTILSYDDYSGRIVGGVTLGTSTSYSVAIDASDFAAEDITFQNTHYADSLGVTSQAVALRTNGDRQVYYHCRMLGYQDTYYTWGGSPGRIYVKDCDIEGTVDFIFGRDITLFDSCTITCLRNNGTLTAANTDQGVGFGYVFRHCTITTDSIGADGAPVTQFYLGRPWGPYAQTVFIDCTEPANLQPGGWLTWSGTNNHLTCYYAEYGCSGPGADTTARVPWSHQLTDSEAAVYTTGNIFAQRSGIGVGDWIPTIPPASMPAAVRPHLQPGIPEGFNLLQNFPNPFNPETTIRFTVGRKGEAQLRVYDLLGRDVSTIFAGPVMPGTMYTARFDASALPSGPYFYVLRNSGERLVRRMLLLK